MAIEFYTKKMPVNFFNVVADKYGGRCVISAGDIAQSGVILQVPENLIITCALAKASPIGIALSSIDTYLKNSEHVLLSLFLLAEKKNPDSFWLPYIELLPAHFDWMPLFYTASEIENLNGSFCKDIVLQRKIKYRREFLVLTRSLSQFLCSDVYFLKRLG
jgi:hypothetical protein